jgi:hypothetical protein
MALALIGAALSIRISRRRARRRPAFATELAAVPPPDLPSVATVRTAGNEPSLAPRIEPHVGTAVRTLRSRS